MEAEYLLCVNIIKRIREKLIKSHDKTIKSITKKYRPEPEIRVCARFQANSKASSLAQIKRIMRYVNGICNYCILYSQDTNLILVGYCVINSAGSVDERKNTSDGCLLIVSKLYPGSPRSKIVSHYQ